MLTNDEVKNNWNHIATMKTTIFTKISPDGQLSGRFYYSACVIIDFQFDSENSRLKIFEWMLCLMAINN